MLGRVSRRALGLRYSLRSGSPTLVRDSFRVASGFSPSSVRFVSAEASFSVQDGILGSVASAPAFRYLRAAKMFENPY